MELTLSKIISWVSGIGLLFLGVVSVFISVVGGIITVLIGLFALPPVRRRITDQTGIGFSRWLVLAVVVVGATAGVGIVGSNIDSSDDTESPAGGGVSESPATEQVADANDEESDSTDQTPEPTATSTPSAPTHNVGESFVVGDGERSVRYTVTNVRPTDNVGGDTFGEDASGEFVIVTLNVENIGDESFDLSSDPFTLTDQQDREFEVDSDAMISADKSIVFEQVNPGLTVEGVVVFDVPPDGDYRLKIEPAGAFSTARVHYVEINV